MAANDSILIKELGIERLNKAIDKAVSDGYSPKEGVVSVGGGIYCLVMVKDAMATVTGCKIIAVTGFSRLDDAIKNAVGDGYVPYSRIVQDGTQWLVTLVKGGMSGGAPIDEAQLTTIVKANVDTAAQAKVDETINGLSAFSKLRTRKPRYEKERIYLLSWNETWATTRPQGGGWFVGHLTSTPQKDDGGYVAAGTGFYWQREKEINDLTVVDFGAQSGGTFDCHDAVIRMYEFMISTYASTVFDGLAEVLRIQFPAGKFMTSPVDLRKYGQKMSESAPDYTQNPSGYKPRSQVHIAGVGMNFGKSIGTMLISDKSDTPMFQINHRRLSVRNLLVDGQQTVKMDKATKLLPGATIGVFNDVASNKQPFLTNDCPAGEFVRVESVTCQNMGGHGFLLTDILDTKFDQVYGDQCAAPFLITRWSDPELKYNNGGWNHSTALELSNFNFQYFACPCVWTPRMGQGLIYNGWMEHSWLAAQWDNTQFIIDGLNVEDCANNLLAWQSRYAGIRQYSGPTGNGIDYVTAPSDANWPGYKKNPDGSDITVWLSGGAFETGFSRLEATYTELGHPLIPNVFSGVLRGALPAVGTYLNLGLVNLSQIGGHMRIEVLLRNQFGSMGSPANAYIPTDARAPGKLIIDIARDGANAAVCTWYNDGSTGVTDVRLGNQVFNSVIPSVWVRLPGLGGDNRGEYVVNIVTTEVTRRDGGSWGKFVPDGKTTSTSVPGSTTPGINTFSFHTGNAGFGARGSHVSVTSAGIANADVDMSAPFGFISVIANTNDSQSAWPLYAKHPKITTQPPATLAPASGTAANLSVTATDAASYQWQKSTDGTTWTNISGTNSPTYNRASVTAADNGQYRVIVRGKLANVDNARTTNQVISSVTTLTVAA